eukprot:NODE_2449_length_1198_cov_28.174064_g2234_i0.p1 GENE.NODE_2449_length_1198_cov_28.174064_g2234_i0~~NODE_2449_length_1198_cov_28.174064_g2234_i0.p1  ORF type:complete len:295 (-),score=35.06 NODE_2449_length_1198_cov_28.174064_g2234_i0:241-1125(-)
MIRRVPVTRGCIVAITTRSGICTRGSTSFIFKTGDGIGPGGMFSGRSVRLQRRFTATASHQAVPEIDDGMPRYPAMSPGGILRGLDYFGTVVFALSGTVTAGLTGMDLLGCTIVGTITAVGGGTIRDVLLGNGPVFWMVETEYLLIAVLTAAATFFLWHLLEAMGIRDDATVLRWSDALGVGAFCIIGAQNAIRKNLPLTICLVCGMMTATFGGLIRDVLCNRPVRILHAHTEIYATTALTGAGAYLACRHAGATLPVRIACGMGTAVGLRWAAWNFDVRLPNFSKRPSDGAKH